MKEGNSTIVVDYLEGFQHKGGVLQFFPHAEGYVDSTTSTGILGETSYNYVYQYKYHLGNVSASLGTTEKISAQSVKMLEENPYYYPAQAYQLRHRIFTVPGDRRKYCIIPAHKRQRQAGK